MELRTQPAPNGDFSVGFAVTQGPGCYRVEATSPAGTARGSQSFEVMTSAAAASTLDQAAASAKAELTELARLTQDIAQDIDAQIAKLPDNPARDELRTRWSAAGPGLQQHMRELGDVDALLAPIRAAVADQPALHPALVFAARRLDDWTRSAMAERRRIVNQLAASRRASVTCESLERVAEGFKLASALSNSAASVGELLKGALQDFGISQLMRLVQPAPKQRLANAKSAAELLSKVASEKGANWLVRLNDLAAWTAGKAFDRYCERLSGNFEGEMHAEFFSQMTGQKWWAYDISFKGLLDLRYAKGSTAGAAVAVKGEFTGQATRFTLDEDAIRIGWPDLTAGARLFKRALLPRPLIGMALSADRTLQEEKPIDIDGKASIAMLQPYGFLVPVEGEIVNDRLSLRIGSPTSDYTANARVVYVIVSPLSIVPVATAFELPYKDAGFFLTRVSGGTALQLPVKRTKAGLVLDEVLTQENGNRVAQGRYKLHLKLCNPAGSC
ncbi:hypothetical protein J7U46_00030 [Pelomonas sp. V22]|uniref:hypothetical protein n=1 Tax=Pelomonas sp. V22 TaxID=2822139 RepID=UPI0024A86A39|nr:hypothetical protein [Pelomonas sp. V22]MDI4631428.1 hypothetical protein [Pelomonas sp. V22]